MKTVKLLFAIFITITLFGCNTELELLPPPEQVQVSQADQIESLSQDDIIALNYGEVEIIQRPKTDLLLEVNGKFTTLRVLTAEDAVLSLASVKDLFGIENLSFVCLEIDDRESMQAFFLQQLYNGLPVEGGSFAVYAEKDGETIAVRGRHVSGISVDAVPALDAKSLAANLDMEKGSKILSAQLVIFALFDDDDPRLAWKFNVAGNSISSDKNLYADANTGDILGEVPLIIVD
jgi:hypothetical protein